MPRLGFIFLLTLAPLVGGCAPDEPNKVIKQIASLDEAERFAPVYHKTYVTLRPMEIWTFDTDGVKGALLDRVRAGGPYTDVPKENVPAGTHITIEDLIRIRTEWRGTLLGEDTYVLAKVQDGLFAGWTVRLSGPNVLIDPRIQWVLPAHLTWIPNLENVSEDAAFKSATQP